MNRTGNNLERLAIEREVIAHRGKRMRLTIGLRLGTSRSKCHSHQYKNKANESIQN
jgi:hypothetical protein